VSSRLRRLRKRRDSRLKPAYSRPKQATEDDGTHCPGFEKPDVKQKSSRKKVVVPQIIITRASNETLTSGSSSGSDQQRTIREQEDWGPYRRHRNPSTADAYSSRLKE
uniref:Spermatosis associated 33 n=1 Tax=Theropithecus gelada TaxID=9565 RepID=A0A8D2FY93_THEGE